MKNPNLIYESLSRRLEKEEEKLNNLKIKKFIERQYLIVNNLKQLLGDTEYWKDLYSKYIKSETERKRLNNIRDYSRYKDSYTNKVYCDTQAKDNRAKNKCKELHRYTCKRCGRTVAETKIVGHHIIPIGVEGCSNEQENLVCLCHQCHRQLHQYLKDSGRTDYYRATKDFIDKI